MRYMAIGLCNSIQASSNLSQRSHISTLRPRFVLDLHLDYNHSQHLSYHPSTSRLIRSISSSINTVMLLSLSHHLITCAMLGHISSYSLIVASCVSVTTLSYYLHTYGYFFVCGNSILLASLCTITLSSYSLSLQLTQLSSHMLDHYHFKVDPLGNNTGIIILIQTQASSPTFILLSIIHITYLSGPYDGRIMDIGYISLSASMGIIGLKVAITL